MNTVDFEFEPPIAKETRSGSKNRLVREIEGKITGRGNEFWFELSEGCF